MAIARSKEVGISPYKLRLVIDQVRGLPVPEAESRLQYIVSPAAGVILKLIRSASANAQNNDLQNPNILRITRIFADKGPMLKRFLPRARGRVGGRVRPSSHITVEVNEVRG